MRESVGEALRKMGTEYIDLYLLHSIGPSLAERHAAWREMVALQKEGTLRHIGASSPSPGPDPSPKPDPNPSQAHLCL